jgi:hypothetical protein
MPCAIRSENILLHIIVLLCAFLMSVSSTDAERDLLEKRVFVLSADVAQDIADHYRQAANDANRQGKKMDRGPAKFFLEKKGVPFPYGASATVNSRQLIVVNSSENLGKIQQLIEVNNAEIAKEEVPVPVVSAKKQPFDASTMDFERLAHKEKIYRNVVVTGNTPIELEISHSEGIATLPLGELSQEIQSRYDYSFDKAKVYTNEKAHRNKANEKFSHSTSNSDSKEAEVLSVDLINSDNNSMAEKPLLITRTASRRYPELLCRDGTVFKNVEVEKASSTLGFQLILNDDPEKKRINLELQNAPSFLLLDFEEFDQLLSRVVVANERLQLYEVTHENLDGGTQFADIAKNTSPGRSFISVPEGYVFANMNWLSLPQSTIELVLPLSGRRFAAANSANLVGMYASKWWNDYLGNRQHLRPPLKLVKKESSKNGVLYSPFNKDVPILGNTTGEMKRLWIDESSDAKKSLALVETGNGLFYGYYDEHAALAESDLTWIDATRDKSARFTLVKKKSTKLKSGDGLFKLFDASTHRVLGADFKELSQLKISSRHFRAMLERGVEAATQDRIIPTGDGVIFPDLGVETASTSALDKVIITDQIEARLKDVVPHAYIFDLETKQRVIEVRKVNSGWGQEMQESRPQRRKKNDVVEVSPDLDGCLRLTDGKRVYELKPFLGGTELLIWEAERNSLKRF